MKSEARRLDSLEIQEELIAKLETLFTRENLEQSTYFVSRMNEKMEIPLQVVYQQKEIYRICPNGRYVLQALRKCQNVTVNSELLVVVPKIQPRKVRVHVRISEAKGPVSLDTVINHIKTKSNIAIQFSKVIGSTTAFFMMETEELATELNNWIEGNKVQNEPTEHSVKEENVLMQFKSNLKEELAKYKEKLTEDKKLQAEMQSNFEFFQNKNTKLPAGSTDFNKVGDRVFANPYNYFFYQQEAPIPQANQQQNQQQAAKMSNAELLQQQQLYYQYTMQMIQLSLQQSQLTPGANLSGNNLRKNNNARNNKNNRSKSRGADKKDRRNTSNKDISGSNNENNQKSSNGGAKKSQKKPSTKMPKQLLENKDANFPALGATDVQANINNSSDNSWQPIVSTEPTLPKSTNQANAPRTETTHQRKTRKQSADKREEPKERKVSESREKIGKERQVSESREKQVRQRGQSINNPKEEVVYVRKGKDIKVTYEKNTLLSIFMKIKDTITPPASIIESSKDEFIPVITLNAPKEIELTKPTEVIENHSNPSTPYQAPAAMPYRKSSISRSNIKRKESERIVEVDEGKMN